jgi:hypothetical protein
LAQAPDGVVVRVGRHRVPDVSIEMSGKADKVVTVHGSVCMRWTQQQTDCYRRRLTLDRDGCVTPGVRS